MQDRKIPKWRKWLAENQHKKGNKITIIYILVFPLYLIDFYTHMKYYNETYEKYKENRK